MFEDVPTEDLPTGLTGVEHDFDEDLGVSRVDAITGWDRVIRFAQAQQLNEINGLHQDRQRVVGAFREGDPALQVIGQVSLARNISPGAANRRHHLLANPPPVTPTAAEHPTSTPTPPEPDTRIRRILPM